jgi:hypothetical protein
VGCNDIARQDEYRTTRTHAKNHTTTSLLLTACWLLHGIGPVPQPETGHTAQGKDGTQQTTVSKATPSGTHHQQPTTDDIPVDCAAQVVGGEPRDVRVRTLQKRRNG